MLVQDSELTELRETIEALQAKNEEAQAVIHVALNNPDNLKGLAIDQLIEPSMCLSSYRTLFWCSFLLVSFYPDVRMQRQNSCESISSLNSLTSISSVGSFKDQDAKKKKKKSWVRIRAQKCFSLLIWGLSTLLSDNDPADVLWLLFPSSALCYSAVLGLWGEWSYCLPM